MNLPVRLFFGAVLFSFSAIAAGQVVVSDAVVKQPVPGQDVTAGYFSLANLGESSKTLVGVSAKSGARVEMHTTMHMDGMMSMKALDSVDIPANATLNFEPGKNHLMLFSLAEDVLKSGSVDLVLEFEDGELLPVTAAIESWK